ncbi:MAG: hypothetical protein VX829_11520 [Pseudomonadota bacterium]|uniref:hypothetical protein n=1 Tax=Methylophaga sp. TaxID=2024840 RepID=UPI002ECE19C6|nr:hypothetical protein [Pseudomonadota bacterium]
MSQKLEVADEVLKSKKLRRDIFDSMVAAIERLEKTNKNVTQDAILEIVGGSKATVAKYKKFIDTLNLDEVNVDVDNLAGDIHHMIQSQIKASITPLQSSFSAKVDSLETNYQEVLTSLERTEDDLEESQKALLTSQSRENKLQGQVEALNEQVKQIKSEYKADLEKLDEKRKNEVKLLVKERDNATSRVAGAEQSQREAQISKEKSDNEIIELRSELKKTTQKLADTEKAAAVYEVEIKSAKKELATIETQFHEYKDDVLNKINELKSDITAKSKRTEQLESELSTAKNENMSIQKDLLRMTDERNKLQLELDILKSNLQ